METDKRTKTDSIAIYKNTDFQNEISQQNAPSELFLYINSALPSNIVTF